MGSFIVDVRNCGGAGSSYITLAMYFEIKYTRLLTSRPCLLLFILSCKRIASFSPNSDPVSSAVKLIRASKEERRDELEAATRYLLSLLCYHASSPVIQKVFACAGKRVPGYWDCIFTDNSLGDVAAKIYALYEAYSRLHMLQLLVK